MKQFNLWDDFMVELMDRVSDQVYKTEWANDYIEADNIAIKFFKGLKDSQCILITKLD